MEISGVEGVQAAMKPAKKLHQVRKERLLQVLVLSTPAGVSYCCVLVESFESCCDCC